MADSNSSCLNINISRIKRHANYITKPHYEECGFGFNLPTEQQCEFSRNTKSCRELDYKLDCAELIFCTFGNASWLPILLLIIIGICLIYLLNLFITKFFVVTTLAIGRTLDMNEYLTGVVVITISNTLYNLYFVFYSHHQNPGVIYNSTVGTAVIGCGIIVPIIILMMPHKIIKEYMLIDGIFVICNFIWLELFYAGHKVSYLKSIGLACGYVVYIVILWIDSRILRWHYTFQNVGEEKKAQIMYAKMPFKIFANMKNKKSHTNDVDKLMVKARRYAEWFSPSVHGPANEHFFKQFKDDLLKLKYSNESRALKIKQIIDTPFVVLFRFIVPVIDLSKPCHKWSKLLRITNVILFPLVCWFAMDLPMKNYQYLFYATIILVVIIFFTSRTDRAPEYHAVYGFVVYIGYTFITFGIMSIVENIISSMFMLMKFQTETTGHLAIAIFDIIPDISLIVNMVQRGYPKIAWAGCFATIIFRGYLEMGLRFIIRTAYGDHSELKSGAMGPTGGVYGILQIIFLWLGLQTSNFFTRRVLAWFMILTYATFITFSLLVDRNQAHGYATEHLNEAELFEDVSSIDNIRFIQV